MGCNTSKESTAPQAENENSVHGTGDNKEDDKADKPSSAKTVSLPSNGTVKSSEGASQNNRKLAADDKGEEKAATKIQAVFRGHKTRKSIKQTRQDPQEAKREQLQKEFRPEDKELENAATKIQANFRGHLTRKQMDKKSETTSKEQKNQENEEELDIDLSDPDLNKAAVKIQASFRGHMVRKEHENEPDQNNQSSSDDKPK